MREGVRRVPVLEQPHQPGLGGGELFGEPDRAVAALLARREHDFRAVDLEQLAPLDRDVLGHDDPEPVPAAARDDREPDARVARRRLEDGVARGERTFLLRQVHHLQRDAILRGSSGVLTLELGEDPDVGIRGQLVDPDERRVADKAEDVVVAHARAAQPPATAGRIEMVSPSTTLVSS